MDEELKKLLGDALAGQVSEKLGEMQVRMYAKGQKLIVDDGQLIPKYRLDEVIAKRDALQSQVEQAEKDLKTLKKAAEGNTSLVEQIESLQKASKESKADAEAREGEIRKTFSLKEALMNSGVSDPEARDLLALKFDLSKVEVTPEGKIKGFDDLLKPIKENKVLAALFGTTVITGQEPGNGGNPDLSLGEWATKNPWSKATRNIATQVELQKSNPGLAAKLKNIAT